MSLLDLVVLAVVQGLTEFLPVSSSGHLVIASALLLDGTTDSTGELADVSISLHVGTLLAIVVCYFRELLALVTRERRMLGMVVVGSLPAATLGVPVKLCGWDESLQSVPLASVMLVVTGVVLLGSKRVLSRDRLPLTGWSAWWIGCAQALAIVPGLSRSGLTIVTGLARRLDSETAATFSFLLAVPAIAGAGLLQVVQRIGDRQIEAVILEFHMLLATGVSFVVGWVALRLLLATLRRGHFQWFAAWCIPLGIFMLWTCTGTVE